MFYDFLIQVYKETSEVNEIGQQLTYYISDYEIRCDVQPSTEQLLYKTFGRNIESTFTVFCDEDIKVGTIVKFNEKVYRINQKIDWISYRIYSIVDSEVTLND